MSKHEMLHGLLIYFVTLNLFAEPDCKPQIAKKLADWAIISNNTADIPTSEAFTGNNITYFVTAHPHNKANTVSINSQNGIIKINAVSKDNFDVVVQASNDCGDTSMTFNVQVDQEE